MKYNLFVVNAVVVKIIAAVGNINLFWYEQYLGRPNQGFSI